MPLVYSIWSAHFIDADVAGASHEHGKGRISSRRGAQRQPHPSGLHVRLRQFVRDRDVALPLGRNSPQKVRYGLYAEQFVGLAFHRAAGYEPALLALPVKHSGAYRRCDMGLIRTAPFAWDESDIAIGQLRWGPVPLPDNEVTFVTGLRTITFDWRLHSIGLQS